MKISETFIEDILKKNYPIEYASVYDDSMLIQYLDKKMKAVHGDNTSRRSLASIYAIYSILYYYKDEFYDKPEEYKGFPGYDYMQLFRVYRSLYGGTKLQNHALNSRVNGEFRNKFPDAQTDLIIVNEGKYLVYIDYIYVHGRDTSKVVCEIIEKYINLLIEKDSLLVSKLNNLRELKEYSEKKIKIGELLTEDAEARIFEIISYAILRSHYKNIKVYFGWSKDDIKEEALRLYKTGRTNANDGGIDFVMRPLGRFFQVTEVNNYDKYLLDMDKVMHFPITFVIKTNKKKYEVYSELEDFIRQRTSGMYVLEGRYRSAIEEIITINELKQWLDEMSDEGLNEIVRNIDIYYRIEMDIELTEDDDEGF